jgi:outer membrane protein insertion porin family
MQWMAVLLLFVSSCSVTKKFKENEFLLKQNEINIVGYKKLQNRQKVHDDLKQVAIQKPNIKAFGFLPFKLWFYTAANKDKENKVTWWIKNKVGEPPVIYDSLLAAKSDKLIQNYMQNYGYFQAQVSHELKFKKKKVTVAYTIVPGEYWKVGNVLYPRPTYKTDSIVWQNHHRSMLKPNTRFDITNLKAERERIENDLKNSGFYFFTKDYVNYELDTNNANRMVNINVYVNQPSDSVIHQQYWINNVYTTPDFGTDAPGQNPKRDTLQIAEFSFISKKLKYHTGTLLDGIFFKRDQLYQRDNYLRTVRRFSDLGSFKFVSVDFAKANRPGNFLDAVINLTPAKRQTLGGDIQGNYTTDISGGFFGVSGGISYKNRNLFKRSDLLVIELNTGFQFQFASKKPVSIITNDVSASTTYYFNKFLFSKPTSTFKFQRPKTKISLTYSYEKRFDFNSANTRVFYYTLHNFGALFGYEWEPNTFMRHQLNPFVFSLYILPQKGADFITRLNNNPSLKNSFEERIIFGPNYTFFYTNQKTKNDKKYIYNRISVEAAGNLLMAGFSLANLAKKTKDTIPYKIAKREFAEYFRIENEFRGFYRFDAHVSFAGRGYLGLGLPYGNSKTMPFIKQFYTGGPNSLRGFRIREMGPGSYVGDGFNDPTRVTGFFSQAGDIKIELNGELRFDIYKWLKGAVFTDVGNIWLLNKDAQRPNAEFDFKRFWNEFAVDIGAGVRLDFSYFVIRFDYGIPVRDPRYTTNKWRFKDKSQFGQFQLAVGYPF